MTELKLSLPDNLAKEAAQAGLLSDAEIGKLLREEIRRRATNELFDAMDRMAAVEGTPMTGEEIQAEIDAVRSARRACGRRYQHRCLRAALDRSTARADLIISGDRYLRNIESHQGSRIVSTGEAQRLITQ